MKYVGQTEYDHENSRLKRGVLVTNLGTPDEPTASALRRYLSEFLSDPRVVEVPRLLWWIILHGIILRVRPARSAKLYQQIWTEEGSPLLAISLKQREKLQALVDAKHPGESIPVVLGMRYGNPSIAQALEQLRSQNVREIIVLPLYPQYSGATVGSTFDALSSELTRSRWVPELHFVSGYHTNSRWIDAVVDSIRAHVQQHGQPEKLLFSYHGTPQKYLQKGDPYHCFCHQTTRLIVERLGWSDDRYLTTFQSRFGREPWLQPYTDETLQELAKGGCRSTAVICPGFSADCLETIEEIEVENRGLFLDAGGTEFHYIKALNSDAGHIEALYSVIEPLLGATPES